MTPEGDCPVVVLGATATGKTALAAALAEELSGEVISFDSSCVHRGLDVGTAKPSLELRARVPHHLVDSCDPEEAFSAARFVAEATRAIAAMRSRGRRVILAGGTGLYLRALLRGLAPSPPADRALRARLEERERLAPGSLHRLLSRLDPAAARATPPRDGYRIVRALEHGILTGRPLSAELTQWSAGDRMATRKVGLFLPRPERAARIRQRVDDMLAAGLVEEVRHLLDRGVPATAPAFRAVGYRDVILHLEGRIDLETVRHRMVLATTQLAKRQDTWFRREPGVTWIESARDESELPALVRRAMMALDPPDHREIVEPTRDPTPAT